MEAYIVIDGTRFDRKGDDPDNLKKNQNLITIFYYWQKNETGYKI